MIKPFKKNAVYQDLHSIPDNTKGQIIDGDLWALPRAHPDHAFVVGEVHGELRTAFPRRAKSWMFLMDVEIALGPHLLVPDVSGWRHERMSKRPKANPIDVAPDWVCEVLSPSTAFLDKGRKREIFAQAGVKHVWLVDPASETVEVLQAEGKTYVIVGSAGPCGKARLAPFDSFELDMDEFWGDEPENDK